MVAEHFRPEFINRIDELVVFHALRKEHIQAVAEIQLEHLRARLAERELAIELDSEALAYLAEAGFDPVYGARPLKRAIQQLLENPLATSILAGDFKPGDTVLVTATSEGLTTTVRS